MNIGYISFKWLTFMFSSIAFCINNLLHAKVSCNRRIQCSLLESYVLIVEESDFYEVIFFENEIIFHLTKQRLHSRLCYYGCKSSVDINLISLLSSSTLLYIRIYILGYLEYTRSIYRQK